MARAALVFHEKGFMEGGFIVEVTIWRLPMTDPERPHGLKYSLYFGRHGDRLVGYDNERGKGDHRHFLGKETEYKFVSVEKMRNDFFADVREALARLSRKE